MLQSEVQALSSELREVREARHVLRAVREEAAQAIQAVRCAACCGHGPCQLWDDTWGSASPVQHTTHVTMP